MSTQEQRERFEAAQRPKTDLAKNRRGDYTNPVVQHCWGTWRAAEAAAIERCAKVAESEPRVWDTYALDPQQRIALKIRALLSKEES